MKRTLRLTNETDWNTGDLRRLILAVSARIMDDDRKLRLFVTVRYRRRRNARQGEASIGGNSMTLFLPDRIREGRGPDGKTRWGGRIEAMDASELACVIGHELGHNLGLSHADMRGQARWYDAKYYAWCAQYPLRRNPEHKPRQRPSGLALAEQKLQHATDMVSRWERRIKSANTWLKKWRSKQGYYEGRVQMMGRKNNDEQQH